jgi:hypothetical protein
MIWSPHSFERKQRRLNPRAPDPYTASGGERGPVTFPVFKAVLSAAQRPASKCSTAKSPVFKRLLRFFFAQDGAPARTRLQKQPTPEPTPARLG